jgi:hypothetical protein
MENKNGLGVTHLNKRNPKKRRGSSAASPFFSVSFTNCVSPEINEYK